MMLAHALGGQLGGWLGDVAAVRLPHAGRIIVCQFSVASGVHTTQKHALHWYYLETGQILHGAVSFAKYI